MFWIIGNMFPIPTNKKPHLLGWGYIIVLDLYLLIVQMWEEQLP